MWLYNQATGRMTSQYQSLDYTGYSGCGDGRNCTEKESVQNVGPIPRGLWRIVAEFDSEKHGPFCLRLIPDPMTEVFGRDGFLIHGDSFRHPGEASTGCIIMPRAIREAIWASDDKLLMVYADEAN